MDGGTHEGEAAVTDFVTMGTLHLLDQAMCPQQLQQAANAATAAAFFLRISGLLQPEMLRNVTGVKPALHMLATQDREE